MRIYDERIPTRLILDATVGFGLCKLEQDVCVGLRESVLVMSPATTERGPGRTENAERTLE